MKSEYWKNPESWPFSPPGYTFLPGAFDAVGRVAFPEKWTGEEGWYEGHGERLPSPHEVFDGDTDQPVNHDLMQTFRHRVIELLRLPDHNVRPTWQQWCDACDKWQYFETYSRRLVERRDAVVDLIHQAAARGDIIFATRSAGEMTILEAKLWNCDREVVQARFEQCAIHWGRPFDPPPAPANFSSSNLQAWANEKQYWNGYTKQIFIETGHLEKAARSIGSKYRRTTGSADRIQPASSAIASPPKKRGRRPKWDWDAMIGELIRIADEDSLDVHFAGQADVERWAASWFQDRCNDHPAISSIREKIAPIYQARYQNNLSKAGNSNH